MADIVRMSCDYNNNSRDTNSGNINDKLSNESIPFSIPDERWAPLNKQTFQTFFDSDGRLVKEHEFRKAVFKGGLIQELRAEAWKYLFLFYPPLISAREQQTIETERQLRYQLMCERCYKEMPEKLRLSVIHSSTTYPNVPPTNAYCLIQQRIEAYKHKFQWNDMNEHIQLILKDIPRTDRCSSINNHNRLTRLLITFVCYHPSIGYAQGMNDMAQCFLNVFTSNEHEAYWCFSYYITQAAEHFTEQGMGTKIKLLPKLVEKIDKVLFQRICELNVELWTFCHRWLFLCFRREFIEEEDTLLCFEVVCSHFLETNSLMSDRLLHDYQLRRSEIEGICMTTKTKSNDEQYYCTFDYFVCIAMIELLRSCLFDSADELEAMELIQKHQKTLNVNQVLNLAEKLFKDYCQILTTSTTETTVDLSPVEQSYQLIEVGDDIIRKSVPKNKKSTIKS
ncbi:unnamed protein product [Didymodactylos carnosus]|uniref:Rab-GAP TBC domain-containing protein n=1 Tax=Didymodactylos carnosus TaxID=1234261 RepID=A0A813RLT1_9BILA|nr:unnamed protein product [Didymodactylos carnosus]CAF0995674.1 unnamed protein product [Didymodactylos carnosus]CAF3567835.1 unnamed protein product [Didymodactylos carnosus]CAF3765384.1 unnamed protein product [Didymodactylos carnosus]